MVSHLVKVSKFGPSLPVASAMLARVIALMQSADSKPVETDKKLMFSEAARRRTFKAWPHMNYRYVRCYIDLWLAK